MYSGADWLVHVPEYIWLSDGASFGITGDYFTSQEIGTLTHAYFDYVRVWHYDSTYFPSSVSSSSIEGSFDESSAVEIYSSSVVQGSSELISSIEVVSSSNVFNSSDDIHSSIIVSSSEYFDLSSAASSSSFVSSSSDMESLDSESSDEYSSSENVAPIIGDAQVLNTETVFMINHDSKQLVPKNARSYTVYSFTGKVLDGSIIRTGELYIDVSRFINKSAVIKFK